MDFYMRYLIVVYALLVLLYLTLPIHGKPYSCLSLIYCQGRLLDTIQRSGMYQDSKTFVDMPTKKPEAEVLANFYALPSNATLPQLHQFVLEHFEAPGTELDFYIPSDWHSDIALLKRFASPAKHNATAPAIDALDHAGSTDAGNKTAPEENALHSWIEHIHLRWKSLLRQYNTTRLCNGCVSSSLKLEHPFVIPGGRFREFYYWDSYWILEGLLISEMWDTAKGIILNFCSIIESYGFIPNGSRIYYLNRSQPPMLPQMVKKYIEMTGDWEILKVALPLMDREYLFWRHYRSVEVELKDSRQGRLSSISQANACPINYTIECMGNGHCEIDDKSDFYSPFYHLSQSICRDPAGANKTVPEGRTVRLNMYKVDNIAPRPESHMEDLHLSRAFTNESDRINFFRNVATGAESGWDFSSRWIRLNLDNFKGKKECVKLQSLEDLPSSESSALNLLQKQSLPSSFELTQMDIINIIPIDLNSLMFANEKALEFFHIMVLNNGTNVTDIYELYHHGSKNFTLDTMAKYYREARRDRFDAMKALLWDKENTIWSDFNVTSGKLRSQMMTEHCHDKQDALAILENLNLDSVAKDSDKAHPDKECEKSWPSIYISDFSPLWYLDDDEEDIDITFPNASPALVKMIEEDKAMAREMKELNGHLISALFSDSNVASNDTANPAIKDNVLLKGMRKAIWEYSGGIPTSEVISGQQWDFPNAWAPFQLYMARTLLDLSRSEARREAKMSSHQGHPGASLAEAASSAKNATAPRRDASLSKLHYTQALSIGNRWIKTTYCGWNRTGQFFEKYNVNYPGLPGDGGEYAVQEGFGWTNAVILAMLDMFQPGEIVLPETCHLMRKDQPPGSPAPSGPGLIIPGEITDKTRPLNVVVDLKDVPTPIPPPGDKASAFNLDVLFGKDDGLHPPELNEDLSQSFSFASFMQP